MIYNQIQHSIAIAILFPVCAAFCVAGEGGEEKSVQETVALWWSGAASENPPAFPALALNMTSGWSSVPQINNTYMDHIIWSTAHHLRIREFFYQMRLHES
jgi:hypothetical protein